MVNPKHDILVVDDTLENLQLLVKMLSDEGYNVRPAPSGGRAIVAVQERMPDLILLDIMMPDMDGYEVCQHLKADKRTRDVPVIFISALNELFDKIRAFSIGGVDYITKPFQAEDVLARVKTHLTICQLQQELQEKNEILRETNQSLEEKVQHRTAELAEANETLRAEIEQRIQYQEDKDRLFRVVSQQSEQLRNLTKWLIETQKQERQGLATGLDLEIQQNIILLQSNLELLQTMLSSDPVIVSQVENSLLILEQMADYVQYVKTGLDQSIAQEDDFNQDPLIKLTERELEVLQLLVKGKTSSQIAKILTLSPSSVHTYNHRIKSKLRIHDMPGLVKFAMDYKLVK
jgi:DNA-binding response OmpR family regulator/DNA-binding CsgD family transcriptional regulator